ncbi:MAG TPA: DUF4157 domain-containing protein, partial [Kofleriaceae bacterium]|nr:DUF4157 domain-containing protein [Kofleriaceae bacterium]
MTEREHTHRHHDHAQHHDVDADIEHGRHAASMSAPERPLASGLLMRKARDSNGVAEGAEAVVASAAGSSGFALPAPVMRKFEDSLGTDLSSVRVHTGGASEAAASAVGARAYTTGQDIHFGAGQYDPSSTGGQHLLAHEVAHTVQQRGGSPMRQNKGIEVSAPHDAAEHEADRAADAMVAGRAAEVTSVSGLSRQVWRGLATAYSDDKDLKQLPPAPKFSAPDGAFTAMAAAVQASMKGEGGTLTAPTSSFDGSTANLIACRDNAEASQVYYATNVSSKWNPIKNNYDVLAKIAQADAQWAISMLANVRVAGSATGSWVSLANASNSSWADLVKHAESMSIEVKNKVEAAPLAGIVDGKQHFKKGDQEINTLEVGGAGMGLGTVARQLGIKAPDTSSYKTAMADYNLARNKLAPQQQRIITQLIPTNVASIKDKVKNATDEKEKWETIKSATSAFETGLSVAFGGAGF